MKPDSPLQRAADWVLTLSLYVLALNVLFSFKAGSPEAVIGSLRTAVTILAVVAGTAWIRLGRMRRELREMDELLDDVRFGSGTKRDKDAVDILVKALRTPDPNVQETARRTLRKITGQDLGEDPADWEKWWASARATFVRAAPPAPGKK